eukprot:jgi/Chlat1/868/Chrsp107S01338
MWVVLLSRLRELPEGLCELKGLEVLDVRSNDLAALPRDLGGCCALRWLDARINDLQELPESLGDLYSLEHLCVSNNALSSLPRSIRKLGALASLDLAANHLRTIPVELCLLPGLRELSLFGNAALPSGDSGVAKGGDPGAVRALLKRVATELQRRGEWTAAMSSVAFRPPPKPLARKTITFKLPAEQAETADDAQGQYKQPEQQPGVEQLTTVAERAKRPLLMARKVSWGKDSFHWGATSGMDQEKEGSPSVNDERVECAKSGSVTPPAQADLPKTHDTQDADEDRHDEDEGIHNAQEEEIEHQDTEER